MTNFKIEFAYPWLLLLLIPALFLALFFHFRLEKKFRRTRNRIISLVLHIIVSVLCITVLSGMTFSYDTVNADNEIIIVTDCSFSGTSRDDDKIAFVRSIIEESDESYRVGVVTFGYDQVYAAPLSNDGESVYKNFVNAALPDNSATDIASALQFARDKIKHPKTAKIVLVSDGVETDRKALDVIRAIVADGVQVNAAYYKNEAVGSDMNITDVIMPETNPAVGETFRLGVIVNSSVVGKARLVLNDNGKAMESVEIDVDGGLRDYYVNCTFETGGLHVLKLELSADGGTTDEIENNNVFYTYIKVENYNKVLIIERNANESDALKGILTEIDDPFEVSVINVDSDTLPYTVDELRAYDQIILNNIANADMPEGFIENLNSYVKDFGGAMFTVGGNKVDEYGETVPNAYNEADMRGTLYQDMLPVQVINFTPPVAVMIIIDKSGSMTDSSSTSGQSKIDAAKDGARAAVRALTSRDYCGIMTLTDEFTVEQSIVPVPQYEKLYAAIDGIEANGGTYYTPSIERAGRILAGVTNVERRHIILVSDGIPNDSYNSYAAAVRRNYANAGITFSFVAIDMNDSSAAIDGIKGLVEEANGRFYNVKDTDRLVDRMREELKVDEIKGVNYENFVPTVKNHTSVVSGINPALIPSLGGFYGTRVKDDQKVSVPLDGKYVPIYAQWQYGEGRVGSFMCDLAGSEWSQTFVTNSVGKQLVINMVKALMPTRNIHPQDIDVGFEEDNYTTNISVFTTVENDEKLRVSVTPVLDNGVENDGEVIMPAAQSGYSRMSVAITQPGLYKITVDKLDAQDNVIGTHTAYRAFSYSKEYDVFYDEEAAKKLMTDIAALGNGKVLEGAWQLFDNPHKYDHHVADPRIAFIIISIVLFLLDIAVRKFKFKWIHELVRERKLKKTEAGK